jgi:hypothetical protein
MDGDDHNATECKRTNVTCAAGQGFSQQVTGSAKFWNINATYGATTAGSCTKCPHGFYQMHTHHQELCIEQVVCLTNYRVSTESIASGIWKCECPFVDGCNHLRPQVVNFKMPKMGWVGIGTLFVLFLVAGRFWSKKLKGSHINKRTAYVGMSPYVVAESGV